MGRILTPSARRKSLNARDRSGPASNLLEETKSGVKHE